MPGLVSAGSMPTLSEASSYEEASDLALPEHVKPILESVENKSESLVSASPLKKGIEVVALRKGFYNQHRLKENETFTVKSFEDLGEWMKCLDPDLQKKHFENLKNKKAMK